MQREVILEQQTGPKLGGELPIKEHVLMVNDLPRGQRYLEAMRAKIKPGDVVLEVGTGAGLLSCMAAHLGAKRVYTVEQSPQLQRVAEKVFQANGVSERVTLVNANSKDLSALGVVREPIDVFVTETIGAQGLDEGIVPVFEHVKPLLAPNARVIPESVVFNHCLVNMTGIRERFEILHPVFGFDLSALNQEIAGNSIYWLDPIEPWREVSSRGRTRRYDLSNFEEQGSVQQLVVTRNDVCDGMLIWAEFELSEGVSLETRYTHLGCSWANSVHFMERCWVDPDQVCRAEFRIAPDRVSWSMSWNIGPSLHG